ncbi:hypothetical protein FO519_002939 [Halicephalobus sp. NKZ332]|nr:hypothetical protein FO519_002939 [Halicephalobus sp. NKZ332]
MNKVVQRHVSEPSTAYESQDEKWRYCSSESEEVPQESSSGRYASDPCLASNAGSREPTFPNVPWSRTETYPPTVEGLHLELIQCYNWLRPTNQELCARTNVCQKIQSVFRRYWPNACFYVFGSVATNLFLPTSDIDITIEYPSFNQIEMRLAADILKNEPSFLNVNVLDRAHVPIIKLVDRDTGINIDISFNTVRAQHAVEYIRQMRSYYPVLELLTLLLKQFLAARQLNHAFTGGLSSYGLVLMIIHFMLRKYKSEFLFKKIEDLENGVLGDFFLKFLQYYGNEFDPMRDALAFPNPFEAVLIEKASLTAFMQEEICASIFCVQDPINPANDVGRAAHNFMQVKMAFYQAFLELDSFIQGKKEDNGPMLQSIMVFSDDLIELRKRIEELPFEAISNHPGNSTGIFGGQPPYGHFGPYHPSLFFQKVPVNGHFMTPNRSILFVPHRPLVLDESVEPQNSSSDSATSSSMPIPNIASNMPYIPGQATTPSRVLLMYPPPVYQQMPLNYVSAPPQPFYQNIDAFPEEFYHDQSEESVPEERKESPGNLEPSNSSTSSASLTSCTTVTPDCDDSDEQRLSSSDSTLSD